MTQVSLRPAGGATQIRPPTTMSTRFQPSRPMRGATVGKSCYNGYIQHFNPRAPCGARPACGIWISSAPCDFNPRAPCGARPSAPPQCYKTGRNFNPRALCGARRLFLQPLRLVGQISIRAPRAGRDDTTLDLLGDICGISIRAPRAGRDGVEVGQTTDDLISILAPHAGRDA